MTLGEFTSVLNNSTIVKISLLTSMKDQVIYEGKLYRYGESLDEEWPDNNFKNFDVTSVEVKDGGLDILIEE